MVCQAIKLLLEYGGHEVETVHSGEAALAVLASRAFDIVISDFSMPGMRGDELATRIRQRWPMPRIILTTGFLHEYQIFHQPAGNVDAVLLKPFSYKELCAALGQVLAPPVDFPSPGLPPVIERPVRRDFLPPQE